MLIWGRGHKICIQFREKTELTFTISCFVWFYTMNYAKNSQENVPTAKAPFHWFSQSVFLGVKQVVALSEPRNLSLWLPSFLIIFPIEFQELSQLLQCVCSVQALTVLARLLPLFVYNNVNSILTKHGRLFHHGNICGAILLEQCPLPQCGRVTLLVDSCVCG